MKDFELTLPKVEEVMNTSVPFHSNFAKLTYKDIDKTFLACTLGLATYGPWRDFWTQTPYKVKCNFSSVYSNLSTPEVYLREIGICPILVPSDKLYEKSMTEKTMSNLGLPQVKFGEYPKFPVSTYKGLLLTKALNDNELTKTGKTYTFDETGLTDIITPFKPITYEEYEYLGDKFIYVKSSTEFDYETSERKRHFSKDEMVWIQVAPLLWLINEETKTLMSRDILLAGIQFNSGLKYDGNFANSNIKCYLDTYMTKEILSKEYKPLMPSILDEDEDLQKVMFKRKTKN